MSHTLGTICATHGWVMDDDRRCPEHGCIGGHGYTVEPCCGACPMSPGGWLEEGAQIPADCSDPEFHPAQCRCTPGQRAWLDQALERGEDG